jgi:hypothetical protein
MPRLSGYRQPGRCWPGGRPPKVLWTDGAGTLRPGDVKVPRVIRWGKEEGKEGQPDLRDLFALRIEKIAQITPSPISPTGVPPQGVDCTPKLRHAEFR